MGLSKIWGKDPSTGQRGFCFSHVKTCYYNWASKILLKDKLDQMDGEINSAKTVKTVALNTSSWSGSYPYSQVVSISGIKNTDRPIISLNLPAGLTADAVKKQIKAYSLMYRAETGTQQIIFYAYQKPATNFQVTIKGV